MDASAKTSDEAFSVIIADSLVRAFSGQSPANRMNKAGEAARNELAALKGVVVAREGSFAAADLL